jgi:hypothetical protein
MGKGQGFRALWMGEAEAQGVAVSQSLMTETRMIALESGEERSYAVSQT